MTRNDLATMAGLLLLSSSCISQEKAKSHSPAKQEQEIRELIEQLVFADGDARNDPILTPGMVIPDADGNTARLPGSPGYHKREKEYDRRYERCQLAFRKLAELKGTAIPFVAEHLDDKRQSINFRNHSLANSVGDACYWNIYFQLQDRPRDYSRYGYQRKGKDGALYPKPYWKGTPFDSDGGLKQWLARHRDQSYVQKQIECLHWLVEKETAIGACDADSYFINILPLEIRILERRLQAGENVEKELKRLQEIKKEKLIREIPASLLPDNYEIEEKSEQSSRHVPK